MLCLIWVLIDVFRFLFDCFGFGLDCCLEFVGFFGLGTLFCVRLWYVWLGLFYSLLCGCLIISLAIDFVPRVRLRLLGFYVCLFTIWVAIWLSVGRFFIGVCEWVTMVGGCFGIVYSFAFCLGLWLVMGFGFADVYVVGLF